MATLQLILYASVVKDYCVGFSIVHILPIELLQQTKCPWWGT